MTFQPGVFALGFLRRIFQGEGGEPVSTPLIIDEGVNLSFDVSQLIAMARTVQAVVELEATPAGLSVWASSSWTPTVPTVITAVELVGTDTFVSANFDRAAVVLEDPAHVSTSALFFRFATKAILGTGTVNNTYVLPSSGYNDMGRPELAMPWLLMPQGKQSGGVAPVVTLEVLSAAGGSCGPVRAFLHTLTFPNGDYPPYTPR